jgi:apolipoprotein N-acyltransferase
VAVVAEWLLPGVFPWKLGYSQIAWTPFVQAADLFGPEVTTFTLFALAGVLVWYLHVARSAIVAGSFTVPVRLTAAPLLALVVTGVNVIYGWASIAAWERAAAAAPQVRLALVQANPEDAGGLDGLRRLTLQGWSTSGHGLDLVCWPECSAGSYEDSLDSLTDPAEVLKRSREPQRGMRPLERYDCPLLCGGKVFSGYPERPTALHQSALLIDEGCIIGGASMAEQCDFSGIGAFLNQSRVAGVVAIELGAVCRFPPFRQERGMHANEVLAVIRKNRAFLVVHSRSFVDV